MKARLGAVLVLVALATTPAVSWADHGDANLPWTDILPALPTGSNPQPHPTPRCDTPSIDCVHRVVDEMTRRWRPLDRTCDHRAVFALTYLRTTEGLRDTLLQDPKFFDDPSYLFWEDALFADYYFRAYDAYVSGKGFVPDAWRIAFDTNLHGDANGGQDVLLGMNAHIHRDLPYVLAEMGLHKPNGDSRKPDHDRVNGILSHVLDPIQAEVGRRYDPYFEWTDLQGVPADEEGVLELLKSWREDAWRNAEKLLSASTDDQRRAVAQSIENESVAWAASIASGQQPGWRDQRDAYCRARASQEAQQRAERRALRDSACGRARRQRHAKRRRQASHSAKAHRRRKAKRCRHRARSRRRATRRRR